jgi:hypothetical protein
VLGWGKPGTTGVGGRFSMVSCFVQANVCASTKIIINFFIIVITHKWSRLFSAGEQMALLNSLM